MAIMESGRRDIERIITHIKKMTFSKLWCKMIPHRMDVYNEATKDKKMESFAGLEGKIKIR